MELPYRRTARTPPWPHLRGGAVGLAKDVPDVSRRAGTKTHRDREPARICERSALRCQRNYLIRAASGGERLLNITGPLPNPDPDVPRRAGAKTHRDWDGSDFEKG